MYCVTIRMRSGEDLDYQTMKEYDRFEKGAANSNTSTAILKRQLENPDAHIIIPTIQIVGIRPEAGKFKAIACLCLACPSFLMLLFCIPSGTIRIVFCVRDCQSQ